MGGNAPAAQSERWHEFFEAAGRKVGIAAYHESVLREVVQPVSDLETAPPIRVQAHFEGVVVSAVAAIDQIAQDANAQLRLGLAPEGLVRGVFEVLGKTLPSVRARYEKPLGRDLRRIRTRIVHYTYTKSPTDSPRWSVESAGTGYEGSRELVAYAQAAVRYAEELRSLLPAIEAVRRSTEVKEAGP